MLALLYLSLRGELKLKKRNGKRWIRKRELCLELHRSGFGVDEYIGCDINPARKRNEVSNRISQQEICSLLADHSNHFRPTTGRLHFVPLILRAASYPGITMETGDGAPFQWKTGGKDTRDPRATMKFPRALLPAKSRSTGQQGGEGRIREDRNGIVLILLSVRSSSCLRRRDTCSRIFAP